MLWIFFQYNKLKDELTKLKEMMANKDNHTPEEIKTAAGEFQKDSLKLFEIAYKKVRILIILVLIQNNFNEISVLSFLFSILICVIDGS